MIRGKEEAQHMPLSFKSLKLENDLSEIFQLVSTSLGVDTKLLKYCCCHCCLTHGIFMLDFYCLSSDKYAYNNS